MKKRFLISGFLALGCVLPISAGTININGASSTAQTLDGDTLNVGAAGILSINGGTRAVSIDGDSIINNSGTIQQTGTGRTIDTISGGNKVTITNNGGALIQSAKDDTIRAAHAGTEATLYNYGSIISLNTTIAGAQAIDWNAITTSGSNELHNYSTGLIRATGADAVRPGINGIIDNAGTIEALPVVEGSSPNRAASSSDGIDAQDNSGVAITNSGTISGRHGITGGNSTAISISITNNAGGVITGVNGSGVNIDFSASTATIVNSGTITGHGDSTLYDAGDGDGVDVDGTVNLTNNGIIRGLGAKGGANNSEGVSIGGGTIVNNAGAEISGQNTTGSGAAGNGILVDDSNGGNAFAATSITNSGTIRGYTGFGIQLIGTFNDTVTNNAGGVIQGGGAGAAIQTGGGADTLINRGTITGDNGLAIDLEAGDDSLIVEGGAASIIGDISGGTGINSLQLNPGAGQTFAYAGTISNFATVAVQSGKVTFSGANIYSGTTTVQAGSTLIVNTASSGTNSGTGAGNVTVSGTLGGTGQITPGLGNKLTVASGGVIAPGDGGIGTLTVNGANTAAGVLSIAVGGKFTFDLNTGFQSDRIALLNGAAGDIAFNDNVIDFTDLSGGALASGIYLLFTADAANAYSGLTLDGSGFVIDGLSIGSGLGSYAGAQLQLVGNNLVLNVNPLAVPEPGISMWFFGGLGLVALQRFRSPKRKA